MTHLTLVASEAAPEAAVAAPADATPPKYSAAELATIAAYQATLAEGRYYELFNAASAFPRLISGENTEPLPLSFLGKDFKDWCSETGRVYPTKPPTYTYLAHALKAVTGTIFLPNGPALVRLTKRSRHRYVNTYQAFEPAHRAIQLSGDFLGLLVCLFPDSVERHTFVQYCAHMLRFPQVRPSWHPMLLSETGTGKGFIFNDILSPLLCKQTVLVKRYNELTGRFANAMQGTILVQLDDCKTKRDDVQTQLKSLMTEERVLLEEKGLQAGMVSTFTRFFLASNELVPLDLDDTDRRWWIPTRMGYSKGLTGDEGRKDRKKLIQRVSDWLKEDGAIEAVHAYFMNYDLEGFDPKTAPDTATRREQIIKSETVEHGFTLDFLSNHPTKIVKTEELSKAFHEKGMNKPGNKALTELFNHCKYQKDTLTAHGQPTRWWFPATMTKAEAEAVLEAIPAF